MDIKKKFSILIKDLKHKPDKSLINRFDNNNTPFRRNNVLSHNVGYLAAKEYVVCHEMLQTKMPYEFSLDPKELYTKMQNTFMGVYNVIEKTEKPYKEQLQQICIDTVRELYNIPKSIDLNAFIKGKDNMDDLEPTEQDVSLPINITPERLVYIEEEIQKRIILNIFPQGVAMLAWKSAYYLMKNKLRAINPVLIDFYDAYTTITSFQLWHFNVNYLMMMIEEGQELAGFSQGYMKQGYSEVKLNEQGKLTANATGVNTPTLLHELFKSVMEYLILSGVPKDFTEEELRYYYAKADTYQHEIFYYYLAPTIWSNLLEAIDTDSTNIPGVIHRLSKLKYEPLSDILKTVIDNPTKAKTKLEIWKII